MKINANLVPQKAHYFLIFAATAPMLPFLPLFGRQLGLQGGITLTYTVLPFAGVLAKLLAGGIADARNSHKKILILSLAITALGLFSLYFTPSIPKSVIEIKNTNISVDCSATGSYIRHHHHQTPCGREDYLATISGHKNASCYIKCSPNSTDVLHEMCKAWKVSDQQCIESISFSSVEDLFLAERVESESYIPIIEATIDTLNSSSVNSSLSHPHCTTTLRLHQCQGLCDDSKLMAYLDAPEEPPTLSEVLHYPQFWMFLCLMLIAWSSFASVVTLSDTICFMLLRDYGGQYGQQRVWGAIGWGTFVVLAGALIDTVSGDAVEKDYTPAFLLTLALFILDIVTVTRIKLGQPAAPCGDQRSKRLALCSCMHNGPAVLHLLGQPKVLLFVLSCIVVGASTGALWTYQLMLVEEVAAAWTCGFRWIKLLDGLMLGVQCFLGELPFFMLAGRILKKLGHVTCMTVVVVTFGLRFILYSVVQNPWLFLPIEVLQGLTFGLFYTTMATYASVVTVPGAEATVQALLGASFEGLGVAIGGLVGGVLFFQYSGQTMYFAFGLFNVIFGVLFALLNYLLQKCQPGSADYSPRHPVSSTEPIADMDEADAPLALHS
ncbi:major facilitator superfamily domain-containing protein 6 [Hyalella azteca]|uniref:Major facilitator superfamily domain-containing protein 6 n=2 Tax=Hyalella azteca TaxID=294128 RepID=A0A8B7NUQ5_HYAAZ|nr:major facilitator superfamily domain-containing protein 6 [Hyalella azteca]